MRIAQEKIDLIHKVSGWCILGIFLAWIVAQHYKLEHWIIVAIWILMGIAVVVYAIFGHFATDEEKEEFKNVVKEVLNESVHKSTELEPTIEPTGDGCPLINLTNEQKRKVEQILRDLPSHNKKENEINMKEVARFLTALVNLGYISGAKSVDKNGLRLWVESVTGKLSPEQCHFNDAYPSKFKRGIKEYEEIIKETLKI